MKEDEKRAKDAAFKGIAGAEELLKEARRLGLKRMEENVTGLIELTEKVIDWSEEEMETNYEAWVKEFEDRTEMLMGQFINARYEFELKGKQNGNKEGKKFKKD